MLTQDNGVHNGEKTERHGGETMASKDEILCIELLGF